MTPVRVTGADPYGLDADRDGLGCKVSGEGGGTRSPWGLIQRKPPKKEALGAKIGDTLTVVGWSPAAWKGSDYQLCVNVPTRLTCKQTLGGGLTGTVQRLGTWKVARGQAIRGLLKVTLRARSKVKVAEFEVKAFDTVPIR